MPHLTWNDKLVIEKMLKQGYKAPAIARKLGVHHSTVYDETSVDREILDSIMLDEDTCIESEVNSSDPFDDRDEDREYAFDLCPSCGSPIGLGNDGGDGFCRNCADKQ